jgi:hypothetical protein
MEFSILYSTRIGSEANKPPIKWTVDIFLGIKRLGRETEHSLPFSG